MICCWPSCTKKSRWYVGNTWDGTVVFVVCDDHLHRMTKAFPPEKCTVGVLKTKEEEK